MRATAIRFVAINSCYVSELRFPKNVGIYIVAPFGNNKYFMAKPLTTNRLSPGLMYGETFNH